MRLITVKIDDYKSHPQNPNQHSDGQVGELGKSLEKFGQFKNVVVWKGYYLAGHGIIEAAKRNGLKTLQAYDVSHLTKNDAMALMIADNRLSDMSDISNKRLQLLLDLFIDPLIIPGIDIDFLSEITAAESNKINAPNPQFERGQELQKKYKTKKGQHWKLGKNLLVCGDCTDEKIISSIGISNIDFFFTDPPYGVDYSSKNKMLNKNLKGNRIQKPMKNDSLPLAELQKIWSQAFINMHYLAKKGSVYYITAPGGGLNLFMMTQALHEVGWLIKSNIIWVKNIHVIGRSDYQQQHETILYGWKPGRHYFRKTRSEKSVWHIDKPQRSELHPTMKPVELVRRAMENSSKINDTCADFFCGSGTIFMAGEHLNRKILGVEIDPEYVAITIDRWERLTGEKAKVEN